VNIENQVIFITGANRGLGNQLALEFINKGAKVYAGARNIKTIDYQGTIPVELDITNIESIKNAVIKSEDTTILVNNAGSYTHTSFLNDDIEKIKKDFETNFYGTLNVTREFVPVIRKNKNGSIFNILSALSWFTMEGFASYFASKSAEWSLTNSLRIELQKDNIDVFSLHVGFMNTEMVANLPISKEEIADVAIIAVKALENDQYEILADSTSKNV
jgi:Dehydrogenases with different specificities (related to short-chain alcohol dehydrogenases)